MMTEREMLVAPCGIDCGICELYMSRDNAQLFDVLVSRGIPKEKIPCIGCKPSNGDCPVHPGECATFTCVTGKGYDFCYECNEFPCNRLQPSADRAETLPHNLKVFNLCKIERGGLESFTKNSVEFKKRYYMGKMEIGNGPQL